MKQKQTRERGRCCLPWRHLLVVLLALFMGASGAWADGSAWQLTTDTSNPTYYKIRTSQIYGWDNTYLGTLDAAQKVYVIAGTERLGRVIGTSSDVDAAKWYFVADASATAVEGWTAVKIGNKSWDSGQYLVNWNNALSHDATGTTFYIASNTATDAGSNSVTGYCIGVSTTKTNSSDFWNLQTKDSNPTIASWNADGAAGSTWDFEQAYTVSCSTTDGGVIYGKSSSTTGYTSGQTFYAKTGLAASDLTAITVSGYQTTSSSISVSGTTATVTYIKEYAVSGTVKDASSNVVVGATVTLTGSTNGKTYTATTGSDGTYSVNAIPDTYTLSASINGESATGSNVTVSSAAVTGANVAFTSSLLNVANGETKSLSTEGTSFIAINVAEGGTLVVDADYDLTKINGAGTVELAQDYSLTGSKSTVASGKLVIDSGKTLTVGSGDSQTNSIASFTSVDLSGTIKIQNSTTTINALTVPASATGTINLYDQGSASPAFTLAGNTTLTGTLKFTGTWNAQVSIVDLDGAGALNIDDNTIEANTYAIADTDADYTGTVTVNNTNATVTVSGSLGASTWTKTNGTLNYAGTSLTGTTLNKAILTGSDRITVAGTVNINDLAGNNLSASTNNYAFVGSGTLNFSGTNNLTLKSDGSTSTSYSKIGLGTSSVITVKENGSLTVGALINTNQTATNNASLTVESGATFTTTLGGTQENYITTLTNSGTVTFAATDGTSTKRIVTPNGFTLNDGSTLNLSNTVTGAINKADGATVTLNVTSKDALERSASTVPSTDGEGTKLALVMTDATSNMANASVNLNSEATTLTNGGFSEGDGIYYVVTSAGTASAINATTLTTVQVESTGTLTVDADLTPTKITAVSGGAIAISSDKILDASTQTFSHDEHRALIAAASGDGTLKLTQGSGEAELHIHSDGSAININTNVTYVGTGAVDIVGTYGTNDKFTIASGKTFSVPSGTFWCKRSATSVNGTLSANAIQIGHEASGTYPGSISVKDGGTLTTQSVKFMNYGGSTNSTFEVEQGGTVGFTQSTSSAFQKVDNATYAITFYEGAILTSATSAWKVDAGTNFTMGAVTINGTNGITLANDVTLTGTVTNNGTLAMSGTLTATSTDVFSGYSDDNAIPTVIKAGTGATSTTAPESITIGETATALNTEGNNRYIAPVVAKTLSSTSIGYVCTYCAPYNSKVDTETATAYYVSAASNGTATLTAISDGVIKANTGAIIVGSSASESVTGQIATSTDATYTGGTNLLVGCKTATTLTDASNCYILTSINDVAGFSPLKANTEIAAGKAYLKIPAQAARDFISIVFGDATGLNEVQNSSNVQGSIYDLNGRKLNGLQKGVNIVNGKKIIK